LHYLAPVNILVGTGTGYPVHPYYGIIGEPRTAIQTVCVCVLNTWGNDNTTLQSNTLLYQVPICSNKSSANYRQHCTHAVHSCSLLLQTSHAAWSVCLSVCWAHGQAVRKWTNCSRCRLEANLCGSRELRTRWDGSNEFILCQEGW